MASDGSSELPSSPEGHPAPAAGPDGRHGRDDRDTRGDPASRDGRGVSQGALDSSSLDYVEELYLQYLQDPELLGEGWRDYFAALGQDGMAGRHLAAPRHAGPGFASHSLFNPPSGASATELDQAGIAAAVLQQKLDRLVRNYRVRGHRLAELSPLGSDPFEAPELDPEFYGLSQQDMSLPVLGNVVPGTSTVSDVIDALKETYTRSIGAQFMHIDRLEMRVWLQRRMEGSRNHLSLSRERQIRILTKLTDAVIFEEFLHKKYVGAKSFSLEGGETLIPLLDLVIERAAEQGAREVVFGMAHRGRLNVLSNVLGKSTSSIFREFEDKDPEMHIGSGDVKYHLGYSSDRACSDGSSLHLSLAFNPSHLEFVNPVVMGRTRAKQDRRNDAKRESVVPVVIHGDAAFIGEGVVQETLNMSGLEGYRVGGTLHVIVNNQVGFTTGPRQGRSTTYASDVAKMLQSPIFHVNGEDPEAVAQVVELAMDFRHEFKRDVVIDMYCYRRLGHNEADEPAFTQPVMYSKIAKRQSVLDAYRAHLLELGEVSLAEAEQIADARRHLLEEELSAARKEDYKLRYSTLEGIWKDYVGGRDADVPEVDTAITAEQASTWLRDLTVVPEDFNLNPKIKRNLKARLDMAQGETPLDWAAGEALAFASFVTAGKRVRFTGQDSERGTFSHRHAVFHDVEDGHEHVPLASLAADGGVFEIHNSPLSEAGVLGFEYGYSLDTPEGIVLWEAQFGDFVNAAQVIIDQFIATAEEKWRRLSGLVLLLPHGFEGQGPEHSSARLERFLQLCAEDNMQVANVTTPAQYFHLLRRQVLRPLRKPLIVMTPKSLLRHPQAVSSIADVTSGRFQRVLADVTVSHTGVRRVLLTTGKLYYELVAAREERGADDTAIVRLEQLYPLDMAALEKALEPYPSGAEVVWVQEEPSNMGAWSFLRVRWGDMVAGRTFRGVTRPESASPATGSGAAHRLEQAELIDEAFGA
jgi:2-oxoglutarate dehydrogenase E1 component